MDADELLEVREIARKICDGCHWAAFDFETTGVDRRVDRALGLGLLTDKGAVYLPFEIDKAPIPLSSFAGEILTQLFTTVPVIGWNLSFDLHFAAQMTDARPRYPIDAMIGAWLLNENGPLGLKDNLGKVTNQEWPDFGDLMREVTTQKKARVDELRQEYAINYRLYGHPTKGAAQKVVARLFPYEKAVPGDVPYEMVAPYCLKDVGATALLWFDYIRPALEKEDLLALFYNVEMPFQMVTWRMEHRGVPVDTSILEEIGEQTRTDLLAIRSEIISHSTNTNLRIGSIPEMRVFLFEELGYEPSGRKTKKGQVSLDSAALKDLRKKYEDETNIFNLLLMERELAKLESTYTDSMIAKVSTLGRLHTTYDKSRVLTGRLSSSDPNLQNITSAGGDDDGTVSVRSAFVAPEGFVWVRADLSQAELRVLADRTGDLELLSVYRENRDIHKNTDEKLGINNRKVSKTINFSVVYGTGPEKYMETLRYKAGVVRTLEECKADIEGWYGLYSGIRPWKAGIISQALTQGYIRTRSGRKRHLFLLKDPNIPWSIRSYLERAAVNTAIQGDVADIIQVGMTELEPYVLAMGGELCLQVHDELDFIVPEDRGEEIAAHIKDVLEHIVTLSVPMVAEVSTGPNWGECK